MRWGGDGGVDELRGVSRRGWAGGGRTKIVRGRLGEREKEMRRRMKELIRDVPVERDERRKRSETRIA